MVNQGDFTTSKGNKVVSVRLPERIHARLEGEAKAREMSLAEHCRTILSRGSGEPVQEKALHERSRETPTPAPRLYRSVTFARADTLGPIPSVSGIAAPALYPTEAPASLQKLPHNPVLGGSPAAY